jgi:hypothetical protein
MKPYPQMNLRFHPSKIDDLAEQYGYAGDSEPLDAGKRILDGDYSIENLKVIVRWKSARPIRWIEKNDASAVSSALKFAASKDATVKAAIEKLDDLYGVGIPMASAILTMMHPSVYTIIDIRALDALGVEDWPNTSAFYEAYLGRCREIAMRHDRSLRTLDRALWQWSKEQSQRRNRKCN